MLLKIMFALDNEKMNIKRTAYVLTDLFGDLGGILQIITIVMALLLASYSEQSFVLSAFRKINKDKYINIEGQVPEKLIPKMGCCSKISFLLTRCFKCCNSSKALTELFDQTYKELEEQLEILYLIKNFRKMNELRIKDALIDYVSKANVT